MFAEVLACGMLAARNVLPNDEAVGMPTAWLRRLLPLPIPLLTAGMEEARLFVATGADEAVVFGMLVARRLTFGVFDAPAVGMFAIDFEATGAEAAVVVAAVGMFPPRRPVVATPVAGIKAVVAVGTAVARA